LEVIDILGQSWEIRDVITPLTECLGRTLGLFRVEVRVVEAGGGELKRVFCMDERLANGAPAKGLADLRQWVEKVGNPAATLWMGTKDIAETLLCVPVKIGERLVGTISVERIVKTGENAGAQCQDLDALGKVAALVAQGLECRHLVFRMAGDFYRDNDVLRRHVQNHFMPVGMVGDSSPMQHVYSRLIQAARGQIPVLVVGEKGTGKNCAAQALHEGSSRNKGPLVEVDCEKYRALTLVREVHPKDFGLETYAFRARGGTLLFDHVEKLSPRDQQWLLDMIEASDSGLNDGPESDRDDIRVVCTSNHQLETSVKKGRFNVKLYHAISGYTIRLPALRGRAGDILQLANHFAQKFGAQYHKKITRISVAAMDLLIAYEWPENVGEMSEAIAQAVCSSCDGVIRANHLPSKLYPVVNPKGSGLLENTVAALEYEMVVDALKLRHGNIRAAARQLGTTERIMGCRVKSFKLDVSRFEARSVA
jgi:Nif-specific regulatory protein